MESDDLEPRATIPAPRNLEAMSVGELESLIGQLEAEIVRVKAAITRKRGVKADAEALFGGSG